MTTSPNSIDPGIYAWTFACIGWPLAVLVPCCMGGPGPWLWGPVIATAALACAVLSLIALVTRRPLTPYTKRALLHVVLQSAVVACGLAVWAVAR